MKPSQDLHTLIHSLSPSELRYFRMFARMQESEGEWNYLKLFDAVLNQDQYDEQKLKEAYSGTTLAKNFAVEKHFLFSQLLKCLRNFNTRKRQDLRLREMLDGIGMLAGRGMDQAAWKLLKNTRRLAIKLDLLPILLEIHEWERRLRKKLGKPAKARSLDELDQEGRELASRTDRSLQLHRLYDRFSALTSSGFDLRKTEQKQALTQLLNDPLLLPGAEPKGLHARTLYHQMRGTGSFFLRNFQDALFHYEQIATDWKIYPHLVARHPGRYFRVMGNYLTALEAVGELGQIPVILSALKRKKKELRLPPSAGDAQNYHFELLYFANTGQLEKATESAMRMADFLETFQASLKNSWKLSSAYNLSALFLVSGQFSAALKWVNYLLNHPQIRKNHPINSLARTFELILHYEFDNHDLLEFLLRNSTEFLQRQEIQERFELAIVKALKKQLSFAAEAEKKQVFTELQERLKEEFPDNLPGLNEISIWAESRAARVPIQLVAKEKLRQKQSPSGAPDSERT